MAKQAAVEAVPSWDKDVYPLSERDAQGEEGTGRGQVIGVIASPKGVIVFRQGGGKMSPFPGAPVLRQGLAFQALRDKVLAERPENVRVYRHKVYGKGRTDHKLALEYPHKWVPEGTASAEHGPVQIGALW